jgi:hypothetical protein
MTDAVAHYVKDVKANDFPNEKESYWTKILDYELIKNSNILFLTAFAILKGFEGSLFLLP